VRKRLFVIELAPDENRTPDKLENGELLAFCYVFAKNVELAKTNARGRLYLKLRIDRN